MPKIVHLEEERLDNLILTATTCVIVTTRGSAYVGLIMAYNDFCISFIYGSMQMLFYKSDISFINF